VLASSVICMLGYGMGIYSFGVFFKPMMNEFGWSRALTAGAFSMRNIEGGVTSPLVGWAVDKYGSRPVIFIGAIILGSGFMLMFFVNSILSLYLVYGIIISIGMSTMLYLPNMTALSHWFVRKISRALALLSVGAGVGGFICAPAAALLIIHLGWRYSFVLIGLTIWVVGIPLSLLIRRRPEDMGLLPDGDLPGTSLREESIPISKDEVFEDKSRNDWTLKMALTSKVYWLLVSSFFFPAWLIPW